MLICWFVDHFPSFCYALLPFLQLKTRHLRLTMCQTQFPSCPLAFLPICTKTRPVFSGKSLNAAATMCVHDPDKHSDITVFVCFRQVTSYGIWSIHSDNWALTRTLNNEYAGKWGILTWFLNDSYNADALRDLFNSVVRALVVGVSWNLKLYGLWATSK